MSMHDTIERFEESGYYDADVRQIIEDHLGIIQTHSTIQEIEPAMAHKYHGNFYGLLASNGQVDVDLFWVYLRVNGFTHPYEWSEDMKTIRVPDLQLVNRIVQRARIE